MRSRYVRAEPGPQLLQPALPKHAPLLPILEEIAQRKQMRLFEDLTSRTWSMPQCVLNWTTQNGIECKFYLVGGPGDFRAEVLCWQRNRMVARKNWRSYSINAAHEVKVLLESVHEWTQSLS